MIVNLKNKIIVIIRKSINSLFFMIFKRPIGFRWSKSEIIIENKNRESNCSAIPNIIWTYWDDEIIPDFIQICINNSIALNPDYDHRVLTRNKIRDYISDIEGYENISSLQVKADIIRLELLNTYGGIWIDASVLFTRRIDWIDEVKKVNKYDFIGFYRKRLSSSLKQPIIENWMMCAPPGTIFIKNWLEIFKPVIKLGLKKFHENLSSRSDYASLKQRINMPEYLSAYIAAQIAIKNSPQFNAYLFCAEDTGYFYQECYPQKGKTLAKVWCEVDAPQSVPPLIKFTSQNRAMIERAEYLNINSVIGLAKK